MLLSRLENETEVLLGQWPRGNMYGYQRVMLYLETEPLSRQERQRRFNTTVAEALLGPGLANLTAIPAGGAMPVDSLFRMLQYEPVIQLYVPDYDKLASRLIHWDEKQKKLTPAQKAQV